MACIRPSYLVLLVLVAATLLFYAAYVSTPPFIVRLPTPRSHHQSYNDSNSNVLEGSDAVQNHTDVATAGDSPNKSPTKNTSVSVSVSSPGQKYENVFFFFNCYILYTRKTIRATISIKRDKSCLIYRRVKPCFYFSEIFHRSLDIC